MPTEISEVTVRPGVPGDAELLASIGARTFVETFAWSNTADDMEAYVSASFSPELQAEELASPRVLFLIAESDGQMIGYAKVERSPAPGFVSASSPLELVRFYIDSSFHGRGASHEMMSCVLEFAKTGGHDLMWLGVWEHNARAISFYRKWNFEIAGKKDFILGSDHQTDFVMTRAIGK